MGAGAVGGYYGALLAQAGEAVSFIARGAQLDALRRRGLRLRTDRGEIALARVEASDEPARIGAVDVVLVTVKAYDLAAAAQALRPLVGPETAVIPLLNGVDSAERLAAVVGERAVLGGLAYISGRIEAPGVVRQTGPLNRLLFGERAGGPSERGRRIEAAFRQAGLTAELVADIRKELWRKFLFMAPSAGVCAVTASPRGAVMRDPDTRALFVAALEEPLALARRLGIALDADIERQVLALSDQQPADSKPSMLFDLEQGKPLELEAFSGTVVRLGRELGIATPTHGMIYASLKHRAGGKAA